MKNVIYIKKYITSKYITWQLKRGNFVEASWQHKMLNNGRKCFSVCLCLCVCVCVCACVCVCTNPMSFIWFDIIIT